MTAVFMAGGCSTTAESAQKPEAAPQNHGSHHPATSVAMQMLGKPYRYGGSSPSGFDCSGLVYYAFNHAGYKVPRTSSQQYMDSLPVKPDHIKEGDLLFFRIAGKVSHVAVYLGHHRFIHAPSSGKRVEISSLDNPYWRQRLIKAGRFF